jgi:hypothetical protein
VLYVICYLINSVKPGSSADPYKPIFIFKQSMHFAPAYTCRILPDPFKGFDTGAFMLVKAIIRPHPHIIIPVPDHGGEHICQQSLVSANVLTALRKALLR